MKKMITFYFSKTSAFKLATLFCFLCIDCTEHLFAQTQLEMSVGSYPSPPSGSTVANQTATLLENTTGTTFVAFSPTITYTLSYSNQQYTGIAGISTGTGLSFGTTLNGAAKTAVAASVVNTLGAIGTGANANHTSNPNGVAGTGIDVAANYGFRIFATTEPLYAASSPLNGRYYYGNLTITFNRPVSNPVLHVVGLGGQFTSGTTQGFSMEYELINTGINFTKLSGTANLNVTSNAILNGSPGAIAAACASGAGCGSVRVNGTNITTISLRLYIRGDGLGPGWSGATSFAGEASTLSVSINKPVNITGTVFADANGTTDNIVNGTGSNAGGTLFANLIDANGIVVATTPVLANGTYSFTAIGEGGYTVSISTNSNSQGVAAPLVALPSNYLNTAEGTLAAGDGTTNGITSITVNTLTNTTGVNFGINQLPTSVDNSVNGVANPGGVNNTNVASSNFTGSDPDPGGQINTYKFVSFPANVTSITINGIQYTSATFPVGGVNVPAVAGALPAGVVQIDPINGLVSVPIPYRTIDVAGNESSTSNVTVNYTTTLPVTFSLIEAKRLQGQNAVMIRWETEFELNNEKFIVEKSESGLIWQPVSTINALAANSSSVNKYEYRDSTASNGLTYYRIKQIDVDGAFSYSRIVKVLPANLISGNSVSVFPNPFKNEVILSLSLLEANTITVSITTVSGKVVHRSKHNAPVGSSVVSLNNLNKLSKGIYYVVTSNSTGEMINTTKIVKGE